MELEASVHEIGSLGIKNLSLAEVDSTTDIEKKELANENDEENVAANFIEKKELANENDEENVATNFVVMRRLAGLLTGEELMRFRAVCQDWHDWSKVCFQKEHPPIVLRTMGDIASFSRFIREERHGIQALLTFSVLSPQPQPYTRITISGSRNEIYPGSIRQILGLIGEDIRVLCLPKSHIYHLTAEEAMTAEDEPREPWATPHNEAQYLQLIPNVTHLEIGIGYFPNFNPSIPIPHLPLLAFLQLNFDDESFEGIQESYIEHFIQENPGIRRIHFQRAYSEILPLVDRIWHKGLSLDLTMTIEESDVESFRTLLGKVELFGLSLSHISLMGFGSATVDVLQCQTGTLEKLSLHLDSPPIGIEAHLATGPPVWFPDFPKLTSLSLGVQHCWWLNEGVQFPILPFREGQFPRLESLEADAQLGFPSFAHREMKSLETLKLWTYKFHVPFSSYAPNLKSLTIPNFKNHQVQSSALRHILGGFPKLEVLDLNFMLISTYDMPINTGPNPEIWEIFTGGATPRGIKKITDLKGSCGEEDGTLGKGLEQLTALRHLKLVWCGVEGLKAILFLSVTGKLHRLFQIRCRTHDEPPPAKLERELKKFHDRVKVTTWKVGDDL